MYSARLTQQEKRKDSKDMQGYLACGLHLQEALQSVRPYIQFLLIAVLVHQLTILCKHLCYFQAGGKQSDFPFLSIFHLSVLTMVLGMKQVVPDHPMIRESMPPARYPENTRPACT